MTNLSKIKREKMIKFLDELKFQHNDDDSIRKFNEIKNHLLDKKYGLVWEEHSEKVDEMMNDNIPVFTEDVGRKISIDEKLPYNFILEGDNLQSLRLLEKTHKGRIDVIYIDPPYNRGKNDFVYDDDFIDKTDTYRHSKWLSFMSKRLSIARELLSDNGLIFISIDDNEVATLKMLMDEIFTENLFINQFVWQRNSSNKTEKDKFTVNTEYVLLYAKNSEYILNSVYKPLAQSTIRMYSKDDNDGRGKYRLYPMQKTKDPGPETTYDYVDNNGKIWKCPAKGWRMCYSKVKALENDGRLCLENSTLSEKAYWNEREDDGKRVDTLWNDLPENSKGSSELENIIGQQDVFDNPKPVDLIKRCIQIGNKNAVVLDFFAGSGTAAQAVLKANSEDGGDRKFIICTNNEISMKKQLEYFVSNNFIEKVPRKNTNAEEEWLKKWADFKESRTYQEQILTDAYQSIGICNGVTYPRVKTVITGIRKDGSKYSGGLPANLKYFKCSWTKRKPEDYLLSNALCLHIKEMIELQNAIEIDQVNNVLILNKEDFKKTILNKEIYNKVQKIWINQNILFNTKEMELLEHKGFNYIPKGFFGQELKEVAE